MVVVILLLEIEMVRSMKLHVGEGWVNSHSSPCQLCIRCLNSSHSSLFFCRVGMWEPDAEDVINKSFVVDDML